jgi:hypothetical protein
MGISRLGAPNFSLQRNDAETYASTSSVFDSNTSYIVSNRGVNDSFIVRFGWVARNKQDKFYFLGGTGNYHNHLQITTRDISLDKSNFVTAEYRSYRSSKFRRSGFGLGLGYSFDLPSAGKNFKVNCDLSGLAWYRYHYSISNFGHVVNARTEPNGSQLYPEKINQDNSIATYHKGLSLSLSSALSLCWRKSRCECSFGIVPQVIYALNFGTTSFVDSSLQYYSDKPADVIRNNSVLYDKGTDRAFLGKVQTQLSTIYYFRR